MTATEYYLRDRFPEFYPLTDEQIDSGWHFCPEFDFMLVGPDMPEWDLCNCFDKVVED